MENLLINNREIDFVKHTFYKDVYNAFGIEHINFEVSNWEDLCWGEFKKALLSLGAEFRETNEEEWEKYFDNQKLKIEKIKKRLETGKKNNDKNKNKLILND